MQQRLPDPTAERLTVLHYTGYEDDRSGIVSVVRAVAAAGSFDCVLGLSRGFVQERPDPLPALTFSPIAPDTIGPRTAARARKIAREVQRWQTGGPGRIFHGHSRAGLLVALWLDFLGERRVVATVHSYGRHRWFYRWAARRLGRRLFWLTPAMKAYYRIASPDWEQCMPNSLSGEPAPLRPRRRAGRLMVGGAGMLVPWKRWDLMVEAMAWLPAEQRNRIEFRHVGGPVATLESQAYARRLRERTQQLGLDAQIKWLGWQPSLSPLLRDVDCALVSSRLEPFSMVALEALFEGVPVIAADEGGPRDFIVEGESGWFFRSGDARDLARVLGKLLETNARETAGFAPQALQRFQTSVVAEQWRRVYAETLSRASVAVSV